MFKTNVCTRFSDREAGLSLVNQSGGCVVRDFRFAIETIAFIRSELGAIANRSEIVPFSPHEFVKTGENERRVNKVRNKTKVFSTLNE